MTISAIKIKYLIAIIYRVVESVIKLEVFALMKFRSIAFPISVGSQSASLFLRPILHYHLFWLLSTFGWASEWFYSTYSKVCLAK